MADDHQYEVSSTLDENNFNFEWQTILNQPGFESTIFNSLDGPNLDPEVSESAPDILQFILSDNSEVVQADANAYEALPNCIIPKNEPMEIEDAVQSIEMPNQSCIPASLPASQNWPGEYNFQVTFSPQEKQTKSVAWTFSEAKDKLYIGKDIPCKINFSTNFIMPPGVTIRAMALYNSPESASEVVGRCFSHSEKDKTKNIPEAKHLIRCESATANYEVDAVTKRYSVVVPFENPPVGEEFSTYIYKFTCFSSCTGPNRRLNLMFYLEQGNQVCGRRKFEIRICACPGRDRKLDENQDMPLERASTSKKRKKKHDSVFSPVVSALSESGSASSKKTKSDRNEEGPFQLNVQDYGCFKFLCQMRKFYEMNRFYKTLPPDVKQVLVKHNERKGYGFDLGL